MGWWHSGGNELCFVVTSVYPGRPGFLPESRFIFFFSRMGEFLCLFAPGFFRGVLYLSDGFDYPWAASCMKGSMMEKARSHDVASVVELHLVDAHMRKARGCSIGLHSGGQRRVNAQVNRGGRTYLVASTQDRG